MNMPKIFNQKSISVEKKEKRIPGFSWHTRPMLAGLAQAKQLQFDMRSLDPGTFSSPYHFHRAAEELLRSGALWYGMKMGASLSKKMSRIVLAPLREDRESTMGDRTFMYLYIMGVAPAFQGRGFGGKDQQRIPAE
jgi:hypothetical protein